MRAAVLGLGWVLLALPVLAQDLDCANAEAQLDLNFCAEEDWREADAELNDAYRAAVAAMKVVDADLPQAERGAEETLRTAQRAWVAYRDAACQSEGYLVKGGSIETMMVYGCMANLTRLRTEGLMYLVEPF